MSGLGDLNYLPQSNGDGNEPTYRMSMLPFGTYRNSDGTESLGLALPAMIHQPLMAVERLFGSGNFAKGPDYPGNADDMRTLLFSMYGGNALNPRSLLEEAAASAGPAAGRVASNGLRPGLTVTRTAPPGVPSAWHDIALDGDRIGRAYVREYPNTIQNSNFTIEPEFQRQGIGTEVQAELARMYGKPTVPDSTLSEAGYQRWLKNDPAAVADYRPMSEGANSYSPAPLTDAYFASMGGPPVPGSRAAAGELFSDTGKPSLFGSASYQNQDPQNSYASGGNVADTSGLSGLTRLPDYGFGPMTPTTMAGYPNGFISSREPDPSWGDLALSAAEFPARATVNQFDAAGTGIADALNDPSLPNITNAGVQTGLALMSPELTVGSGLGGLGLAALRDADIVPSAEARRLRRPPPAQAAPVPLAPPPVDPVLDKIKDDSSLLALYQQIKQTQHDATRMDYPGDGSAIRSDAAKRLQALQNQFADALAKRDAAKQSIYNQQVQDAVASRDTELGRDRRFSDTEVGKVYDKLGGYAPLVAGFVPGVVSRLAYGPAENIGSKVLRGLTGATFGVGANNVPLVYNAFSTEVDNPEQRAYQEYAYNLPDGHPDKAKAQAMADSLPKLNQLRVQAGEELYDPEKFKERALMGALEGFGGNELGQMAPGAVGGFGRISSVQLPEKALLTNRERIGLGGLSPEVRAQQEAAAKLLADKQAAASLSSGPVGPVSEQSLPVLGGASDIPPAAPPKKAQGGGRRSKSAGTKGSSKPAPLLSNAPLASPPAAPETQSAAGEELKRFFGAKQAPDLRNLKATGGSVDGKGEGGKAFSGPLHSDVAGRTDHLPIDVTAGSYVIPADVVSALGEGNTNGGVKVLQHMFPDQPKSLHYASGGVVPIMAAGGEHVLSPEQVAAVGGGDLSHGHAILDAFVKNTRNDTIKTLKSLPGPQK